MSVNKLATLLWIILNGYYCIGTLAEHIPPHIELASEYIIDAHVDFNITCTSIDKPQWSFPLRRNSPSHIVIQTEEINDVYYQGSYKYRSVLMIQNASYLDTGYFYCHSADVSYDHATATAHTYLFVKDEENLAAIEEDQATVLSAVQASEVVLPCRPTSPDVVVKLYKNSDDIQENEHYWKKVLLEVKDPDGIVYTYSPQIGFTILKEDVDAPIDYIYLCGFSNDYHNSSRTIIIHDIPKTHYIDRPRLEDMSKGHTLVGSTLVLNCSLKDPDIPFDFIWTVPTKNGLNNSRITQSPSSQTSYTDKWMYVLLKIENVTKEDQGDYSCKVVDFSKNTATARLTVPIYESDDVFINLMEENDLSTIEEYAMSPVVIRVDIEAHPIENLKLQWLNNVKEIIGEWEYNGDVSIHTDNVRMKYITEFKPTETTLEIKNININDFGDYTIIASNNFTKQSKTFSIVVLAAPTVQIKMADFHMYQQTSEISCIATAYPRAQIHWQFKCTEPNCALNDIDVNETRKGLQVISRIKVAALGSGVIGCFSSNEYGNDSTSKPFYVTDVEHGFGIITSAEIIPTENQSKKLVAYGDSPDILCQGSLYAYNDDFQWSFNGTNITDTDNYEIEKSSTQYSFKSKLKIKKPETGLYKCVVTRKRPENDNIYKTAALTLIVSGLQEPKIIKTNLNINTTFSMNVPNPLKLNCYVFGIPLPKITWFRDKIKIIPNNRTELLEGDQVLSFNKTYDSDEGLYSCEVINKVGKTSKEMKVTFKNKQFPVFLISITFLALAVIVLIVTVWSIYQCRKGKQLKKLLKQYGLQDFKKGDINKINPDQGLHEQASWLPYAENIWEFPFDKLKLGKQLGSGAFGVVLKAEAYGILSDKDVTNTTVAVKTLKPNSDDIHLRSLVSELKIMGQMGKHLNVVNLLGACTKNLVKKELYVIVEYCRFGNLQSYLFKHRRHFVSQIDEKTGKFDFGIGADAQERSFSFSSYRSNSQSSTSHKQQSCLKYPSLNTHSEMDPMPPEYPGANYTGQTTRTECTTLSSTSPTTNEDTITSNNSSEGPVWRLHYRGDYMDDTNQLLYTKDLLAWAFQVARGMEYLVSRKVLHRDLAARNILLADNNVVKICDFGLAKETLDYEKKGDTPLPIKWMAVESIQDKVFSTQSDVWSYGIVLWELFSMAKSPYPGMAIDDKFLISLINGYRMEIPQFASNEVYRIMLDCWDQDPLERPSFTDLAERIGKILGNHDKQYYIDLNDPYLVANTQLIQSEPDYLDMFAPPDFEHISSAPKYMNESETALHPEGYMCMKAAQIFSPRPEDYNDGIFNYDFGSRISSKDSGVELQPMLVSNRGNASDCESPHSSQSPPQSPDDTSNSVSNPSYLSFNMPMFNQHQYQNVNSLDNYINMNQKSLVMPPMLGKDNAKVPVIPEQCEESIEKPVYVNSTTRDWDRLTGQCIT